MYFEDYGVLCIIPTEYVIVNRNDFCIRIKSLDNFFTIKKNQ